LGAVAKSLLVCGYIGAAGLGYVWQKNQIYRLGDELKKREATLAAAQKRNAILAAQLAQSKSPAQLEARCRQYNLWLVAPRENQIVRLCEPGAEWDSPSVVAKMLSAAKHNPPAEVLARR
jgi:hypothetical protein